MHSINGYKFLFLILLLQIFSASNAQSWIDNSGKNSLSIGASSGASFPVAIQGYTVGVAGDVVLNYNTKIGTANLLWGYNFLFKPKTNNYSVNLIMHYAYGVGFSKRFLPSQKLFTAIDITYNEAEEIISFMKNPKHTGIGFGLTTGYSFAMNKKSLWSVSANYHYAMLNNVNFSNAGIRLHYSLPLVIMNKK